MKPSLGARIASGSEILNSIDQVILAHGQTALFRLFQYSWSNEDFIMLEGC